VAVAQLAKERHWMRMVIVTSNYHTRRTRYIYERIFPSATSVSVASAHDGDFDPERWWENRRSIKLFTREIAGYADAVWELWNTGHGDEKKTAGALLIYSGKVVHTFATTAEYR